MSRDPRRRFTRRQKAALYLRADGKCQMCGKDLEPSWHADHAAVAYADGGDTETYNGAALCGPCNTSKGRQGMSGRKKPRYCQREAFNRRRECRHDVFAGWLGTGAGKTLWGAMCAEDDLRDKVQRVFFIAPSEDVGTEFRDEMHDQFGLCVAEWNPTVDTAPCKKCDSDRQVRNVAGHYATYAMLALHSHSFAAAVEKRSTLVILDEVHHATDSAWGRAFLPGAASPARVLLMSATPARTDEAPIPFVHDMEGRPDGRGGTVHDVLLDESQVYEYSYGKALIDRVVTRSVFQGLQGRVDWESDDGKISVDVHAEEHPELRREGRRRLHNSAAIYDGLNVAVTEFRAVLQADPHALIAVSVASRYRADQVVDALRSHGLRTALMTGVKMQDSDGTSYVNKDQMVQQLKSAHSPTQALVVVDQFSEGTDIPRTRAYVYMRSTRTRLHFLQSLGRAIRVRPDNKGFPTIPWEEQAAYFYYWDDAEMREFVREVKDEMDAALAHIREAGEGREVDSSSERTAPAGGNGQLLGSETVMVGDDGNMAADDWQRSVEVAEQFGADPAYVHLIREAFDSPAVSREEPSFREQLAEIDRSVKRINSEIRSVVVSWKKASPQPARFNPFGILRGQCNHLFGTSADRWTATEDDVVKAVDWIHSHGRGYLQQEAQRFQRWSS